MDISPYFTIMIPALATSIPEFHMMYSTWKLNKQSDSIQICNTAFPIWNQSVCCSMFSSNCSFLTCVQISQEAGKVVCYFHLLKNFPRLVAIHTVKSFGIGNKNEMNKFPTQVSCGPPLLLHELGT